MPLQETFLEKQLSDGRALVIKTYDANLAHDAFQHIGGDGLAYVANALRLEELFEASDIPETSSPDVMRGLLILGFGSLLVVGCASPPPPRKPTPYRYITDAPLLTLGAH